MCGCSGNNTFSASGADLPSCAVIEFYVRIEIFGQSSDVVDRICGASIKVQDSAFETQSATTVPTTLFTFKRQSSSGLDANVGATKHGQIFFAAQADVLITLKIGVLLAFDVDISASIHVDVFISVQIYCALCA